MKCIKCQSENVEIVANTEINVDCECGVCGREYSIPKIPVGKKDVGIYAGRIGERLINHEYLIVEARGVNISQMLIVVGFFILKDKIVKVEDVDLVFWLDDEEKVVAALRIILKRTNVVTYPALKGEACRRDMPLRDQEA